MPNNWLRAFKIALIEKDARKIAKLSADLPSFKSLEQMQEAQSLIRQAIEWAVTMREDAARQMQELQKTRQFLLDEKKSDGRLDITS